MTNKDKLLHHFYEKYPNFAFKTSDVARWGVNYYSNRAVRDARKLAEDGYIRRIFGKEKDQYGHFGHEDSYVLTIKGIEKAKSLGQKTLF